MVCIDYVNNWQLVKYLLPTEKERRSAHGERGDSERGQATRGSFSSKEKTQN